jgi:hypothetical protein
VAIVIGALFAWRAPLQVGSGAVPAATATLSLDSSPTGAEVSVDGQDRGVTPISMSLAAGQHRIVLRAGTLSRELVINIGANEKLAQFLELGDTKVKTGALEVRTVPPGARILVDGQDRGVTPTSIKDLPAGGHTIVLETSGGSMTERVTIEPGGSALLVVNVPQSPLSVSSEFGWVTFAAPGDVQLLLNGQVLASGRSGRAALHPGRYQLEVVSDELGIRLPQTVQVVAGRVQSLRLNLPTGIVHINATPWAEVSVDGTRLGETPLGNVSLSVGSHEVVFRHPELGERRAVVKVTTGATTRVSMDMNR